MTTDTIVHAPNCASNVSDADAAAGHWVACDCGAQERAQAAKNGAILEDRAGAYLYGAHMAFRRAGDDARAIMLAECLTLLGKPPE